MRGETAARQQTVGKRGRLSEGVSGGPSQLPAQVRVPCTTTRGPLYPDPTTRASPRTVNPLAAHRSLTAPAAAAGTLDVDTVPFVELADGKLRGVVSSGSDVERVYCAFVEAGTLAYSSSTNNNRPDAGTAKRIGWLIEAAVAQFGVQAVARFLKLPVDHAKLRGWADVSSVVLSKGRQRSEPSGETFSRFLAYLRRVELDAAPGPVPEMAWFVG
jgi:hypothetical protein